MRRPSVRQFLRYAARYRGWRSYLRSPGDGRVYPQIDAATLLRVLVASRVLREVSLLGAEALVRSPARRALGIRRCFGDDTLGYCTERLEPDRLRTALTDVVRQAKRNKAFDGSRWIGLAIDGTGAGRSREAKCCWCHPLADTKKQIVGYGHKLALVSVVGTGLSLPFDVEPYGPKGSEYRAGQQLLQRTIERLGARFADYVVVDGLFAKAPFLHTIGDLGLKAVLRLKGNLPELFASAQHRFASRPPDRRFRYEADRVEIWDADDFDPWVGLRWETVRVVYYRQYKANGSLLEAYWLTDFSRKQAGSEAIFRMAKSRWEVENQGFNEAKNHYGLEHICHHHPNSLLVNWLIISLAITLERLYRIRFLHRGSHPVLQPIALLRLLRFSIGASLDTS